MLISLIRRCGKSSIGFENSHSPRPWLYRYSLTFSSNNASRANKTISVMGNTAQEIVNNFASIWDIRIKIVTYFHETLLHTPVKFQMPRYYTFFIINFKSDPRNDISNNITSFGSIYYQIVSGVAKTIVFIQIIKQDIFLTRLLTFNNFKKVEFLEYWTQEYSWTHLGRR